VKLLALSKDGGPLSKVHGFFLVEIKRLFSVAFLLFKDGSREAYHSHAFHCLSWVLWGELEEHREINGQEVVTTFRRALCPIVTTRTNFHKVYSKGNTLVFTLRGPWVKYWLERREDGSTVTLTHGREVV